MFRKQRQCDIPINILKLKKNNNIPIKLLNKINRKWFTAAIENLAQHPLIDQKLNLHNLVKPIEVLHHLQSIDLLLRQKIKI